jgi:hypothetical protein
MARKSFSVYGHVTRTRVIAPACALVRNEDFLFLWIIDGSRICTGPSMGRADDYECFLLSLYVRWPWEPGMWVQKSSGIQTMYSGEVLCRIHDSSSSM